MTYTERVRVADSLFTGASTPRTSLTWVPSRVSSFWAKEGALDWSWMRLNLVNERKADELVVSLEMQSHNQSCCLFQHIVMSGDGPFEVVARDRVLMSVNLNLAGTRYRILQLLHVHSR